MSFASDFWIREQLSESAISIVFRAVRNNDGLPCVIKCLKAEYPTDKELGRYHREFEMVRAADFSGVVRCLEMRHYNRSLMLVYEDFEAISLRHLLLNRTLSINEFYDIATQVVETLGSLHRAQIIHKDINPSNIVVNPGTGEAKIIDFGIASRVPAEQQAIASPKLLEGTLAYMSPEQTGRMNRVLDYRTDFYSLGATFYEMLSRTRLFEADDDMELVHCQIARDPVPLHRRSPEIPLALSKIVMKLLAKTAEDRYQSSAGLLADLAAVRATARLDRFEPGRRDYPEHFRIPQRLYGREADAERLLSCFERVRLGEAEMVAVTGYSGVGKSALIQEVHRPITRSRGYFVSGKFDQLQRNRPYAGLLAAFRDMVRQILTEPEAALAVWRHQLSEALAPNAQVLVDVCPELELVIGPQAPVPELEPGEATNRFNRTIGLFLRALSAQNRVIVLFLDDLQWADAGTLGLLRVLLPDKEIGRLLVIGAYRDNEVPSMHPLALALGAIEEAGGRITTIPLAPLRLADVTRLLGDTLLVDAGQVAPLARLVMQKTQGNPLFVKQFVLALHREQLIRRAPETEAGRFRWSWDLQEITSANITDNVVELLLGRLQGLAPGTQHALRVAACIGNRFDIGTLALILRCPPEQAFRHLQPAVQEELLRTLSDPIVSDGQDAMSPILVREFGFQHDRVQQAAYDLLDTPAKQETHLTIGRRLLATLSPEAVQARVFEVVDHLNRGRALIEAPAERVRLAELGLLASHKAYDSAAYGTALTYVLATLDALGPDGWDRHYAITFDAHQHRATLEYLNGNFDTCTAVVDETLHHARTAFEKAQVYFPRIAQHTLLLEFPAAIAAGRDALALLGIELPLEHLGEDGQQAIGRAVQMLAERHPSVLYNLPDVTREDIALAQRCLRHLSITAFLANQDLWPLVIGTSVQLSLEHGNAPESALSYANFGVILGAFMGQHRTGYGFGELALRLCDRYGGRAPTATVYLVTSVELLPWVRHVRHAIPIIERGYQAGLETGDVLWADYLIMYRVLMDAFGGRRLDQILDTVPEQLARTMSAQNAGATAGIRAHQIVLSTLAGRTASSADFSADGIDEAAFLQDCERNHLAMMICFYKILKAQAQYIFGRVEQALDLTREVEGLLSFIVNHPSLADHLLYQSLALAALWRGDDTADAADALSQMRANLARLQGWAASCPDNYLAKALMVEGEIARILGDKAAAAELYDGAIAAAHDHGFIQDEAVANELAARFEMERRPNSRVGAMFLRDARYAYRLWGAQRKVEELEQQYPEILRGVLDQHGSGGTVSGSGTSGSLHTQPRTVAGTLLDLNTLIKAGQAISSEMIFDRLVDRMLGILVENAGAQRGLLLLSRGHELYIEAEGNILNSGAATMLSLPVDSPEGTALCALSVINYATRTREGVVVDDAQADERFTADPYLQERQTRSVLCQPILHQGTLVGVVYLENNLIAGAFTPERSQLVALLSGQIAVSIKNAEIVQNLESRVRERTEQLELRSRFIEEIFGRYISNEVAARLLTTPEELELGGRKRVVTVLSSDLRGFTAQCEALPPDAIVSMLNKYLSDMTTVIQKHQGTIDGFLGDGILVVFGAPFLRPDDAERAVVCAIEMQLAMQTVNAWNREQGFPDIEMGIGINTGEVVVGNIGSSKRAKYSVIGTNVNLVFRIEGYTVGGQILVTRATRDAARVPLLIGSEQVVEPKGVSHPITLYDLRGIDGAAGLVLPERAGPWSLLDPPLPLSFHRVTGKEVFGGEQEATLVGITARRAMIRCPSPPPLLTNLLLALRPPGSRQAMLGLHAKVVGEAAPDDCFVVHFTAVPQDIRDFLDGLRPTAAA